MGDFFSGSEGGGDLKSRYNSAVEELKRINNLWQQSHRDVRNGDFVSWNITLDRVWSELAGDLKPGAQEETDFMTMNTKIVLLQPLISSATKDFNNKPAGYAEKVGAQYQVLLTKEIFLRRLQNKLGKGTAYDNEDDDDFD